MNLTPNDAKYLLAGIAILIPIIIAWLPTLKISDYAKFGILAVFSLLGGFLTVIATGQLITSGSLVENASIVLAAAQVFYYGAFRLLGLERVLFPQQAVTTQIKEQAKEESPTLTTEQAKAVLDPNQSPAVQVSTKIVNTSGDIQ